jgi:hypothetical protein
VTYWRSLLGRGSLALVQDWDGLKDLEIRSGVTAVSGVGLMNQRQHPIPKGRPGGGVARQTSPPTLDSQDWTLDAA